MLIQQTKLNSLDLQKADHEILCPKCNISMNHTTLMGILLEKCPACEGMFFDKGEASLLVRRHLRSERSRTRFWRWFRNPM